MEWSSHITSISQEKSGHDDDVAAEGDLFLILNYLVEISSSFIKTTNNTMPQRDPILLWNGLWRASTCLDEAADDDG